MTTSDSDEEIFVDFPFEEGWPIVEEGIAQLRNFLERIREPEERPFNGAEYVTLYTTIYDLCAQNRPHDHVQHLLYDHYKESFVEYINTVVLPALREKHDEFMLGELVKRWDNHKIMVHWLSRFFSPLDRYFLPRNLLPDLKRAGLMCFCNQVYPEMKDSVNDAVVTLIDRELEGEQIDQVLLKTVLGIFVEIDLGSRDAFESEFQLAVLTGTSAYYSRKAFSWIEEDSCPVFMLKVEECLEREKERVGHYLHASIEEKLLEKVQHKLLFQFETQLLAKEHSGCRALLREDKVEDLSRMFRLFCRIPQGLEPVAAIFRQHVRGEGTTLVRQAEGAASSKKADLREDMHGGQDQAFVRKLIKLHDRNLQYVGECFGNHPLFHKAFKEAFKPVAEIFRYHVTDEGTTLVKEAEDAASNEKAGKRCMQHGGQEEVFVRKIIDLHEKYFQCLSQCFVNHSLLHNALKEAFEVICNERVAGGRSAELLATVCDNLLKKEGSEKLSDEAFEDTLEKVVKILAFIRDKDLFADFYWKKFARRLLLDQSSANDNHERIILVKLRQQFGGQFTFKMEGMVTDLTFARENQTSFEDYLHANTTSNPGMDLTVTVLNTGFWPSYKSSDLALPAELVKCVEVFKEFYQKKTEHRKLTWINALGTCNIDGNFEKMQIELVVTTYQAAVLLLFNTAERLSYADIKERLNLTDEDVVRLLHSFSCAKHKILNKDPRTETVSPGDCFEFNSQFTDIRKRIKIPLPQMDEKKKVIEDVDRDRRYVIEASIVRIMKARKVLSHKQLILECVQQLRGKLKPDSKIIKKRIEDLIAREFLERDEKNPNVFRYLA